MDNQKQFPTLSEVVKLAEKQHIRRALARTRGDVARAAELLGISVQNLQELVQDFSLDQPLRARIANYERSLIQAAYFPHRDLEKASGLLGLSPNFLAKRMKLLEVERVLVVYATNNFELPLPYRGYWRLIQEATRLIVLKMLQECGWNEKRAAHELHISHNRLWRLMRLHNLQRTKATLQQEVVS